MPHNSLYTQQSNLLYPGLLAILCVVVTRFLGVIQVFELKTFDGFLRFRPQELPDERVTIVEITDEDIVALGTYPIPDTVIADTLNIIQQYNPRSIGLDIFRDFPVYNLSKTSGQVDTAGHLRFIQTVQNNPNIFVIDSIIPPTVSPPPDIPLEQVGFVDTKLDKDGFVRRSLLGSPDANGQYRLSLTILLAMKYLADEGFSLENGQRDPDAMQFGTVELSSAHADAWGYVTDDAGGNPIMLINFRSGATPFRKVSLSDLLDGNVAAEWFEDSVVLIGVTALSTKDFVNSDVVSTTNPGLVSGVEMQAHAISQILAAVLDNRPILKTWPTIGEYLWIIFWGLAGIGLSRFIRIPFLHLIVVIFSSAGIFLCGYLLLLIGWWIPVVPAGFLYFFNGAILYGFYWYGQSLKLRLAERQRVIQQSYSAIHNGPLQSLAYLLRTLQEDEWQRPQIDNELKRLDTELRSIYEFMEREAADPENTLLLTGEFVVDLNEPLHEVLYQVYSYTVLRPLPYFSDIEIYTTEFEPMLENRLSLEQKREVARFFEEALCNAGQYAENATQLEIVCRQVETRNIIRVTDNGKGARLERSLKPNSGGRGTKQAMAIAKTLHGTFRRKPNFPNG